MIVEGNLQTFFPSVVYSWKCVQFYLGKPWRGLRITGTQTIVLLIVLLAQNTFLDYLPFGWRKNASARLAVHAVALPTLGSRPRYIPSRALDDRMMKGVGENVLALLLHPFPSDALRLRKLFHKRCDNVPHPKARHPKARHTRLYALFFFPCQITPKPEIPRTNQYVPSQIKFLWSWSLPMKSYIRHWIGRWAINL